MHSQGITVPSNRKTLRGTFTCECCGTEFLRYYYPDQTLPRFCSNKCMGAMMQGERNHNFKGGTISQGYRLIHVGGKQVLEHRYLMEQHLGRPLLPGEDIHHINGEKLDNRIENFRIMTPSEHAYLHFGRNGRWAQEWDECVHCHSTERPHLGHGYCERCYQTKYRRRRGLTLKGRWTKTWDACVHCHSTERPHAGHGYCERCYQSKYHR